MSNISRKVQDNKDKFYLEFNTGVKPKHRCPKCHRFTIYVKEDKKCVWCKVKELKDKENEK